jgi:hypothetical protein
MPITNLAFLEEITASDKESYDRSVSAYMVTTGA